MTTKRSIMLALVAGAIAAASFIPARAADLLPVKGIQALPTINCTQQNCSGWYFGANLMGNGTNADIIGNGINGSIFAAGGMVGVDAGYQLWNGTFFAAAEVIADYDATGGISSGGKPRYFFAQLVKAGMGLQNLFSAQPTPSQGPVPITVPTSLQASLISPYIQVGAVERPWGTGWATGAGATFVVGGGYNLDLSYLYTKYGNGTVSPTQDIKNESLIKLSLNRMF